MRVPSLVGCLVTAAFLFLCESRAYSQSPLESLFGSRVRLLLAENCRSCHGELATAGLRIDPRASLSQGTGRGQAIVPGDPGTTFSLQALERSRPDLKMPPASRSAQRRIDDLSTWIRDGAMWPAWDSHGDIMDHRRPAAEADPAVTALVRNLKARGLLDKTLVVVGNEFGRTPAVELQRNSQLTKGRGHNSLGFTVLLAGGGVKGGLTYGGIDDFGFTAAENPAHVHDLHAAVLHLLGLDHTRLIYRFGGRAVRLTDVHGEILRDILT